MLISYLSCAHPLFSNTRTSDCKSCFKTANLRINPRVIGNLIDESGTVNGGKLVWSDVAWRRLLGYDDEGLAKLGSKGLQALEARMSFLRVILLVGWRAEVERLVVLEVLGV